MLNKVLKYFNYFIIIKIFVHFKQNQAQNVTTFVLLYINSKTFIMKKIILVFIASLSLMSANSQTVKKAIGARIGEGTASSIEFTYQHPLSSHTRLELDASTGFSSNSFSIGATGLHQWVFDIENGFQWFLGAGASIGNTIYDSYDNNGNPEKDSYFTLALNPNGGVEYWFKNIPLQLSVDARPYWHVLDHDANDFDAFQFSLGVAARYTF